MLAITTKKTDKYVSYFKIRHKYVMYIVVNMILLRSEVKFIALEEGS